MLHFAQLCESIAATTKKNEKVTLVADYLSTAPVDESALAALYLCGRVFPLREERVLADPVALGAGQAALTGPSTVAVHHAGHVAREGFRVDPIWPWAGVQRVGVGRGTGVVVPYGAAHAPGGGHRRPLGYPSSTRPSHRRDGSPRRPRQTVDRGHVASPLVAYLNNRDLQRAGDAALRFYGTIRQLPSRRKATADSL